MKFAIVGPSASVDIRSLPGACVVLGVQDRKKIKFPKRLYSPLALKGFKSCPGFESAIWLDIGLI